jgi:hypothetical protein
LFDGEHVIKTEPIVEVQVRLTQEEVFTGLLVPLFAHNLDRDTRSGIDEMNQAIKAKSEAA